MTKRWRELPAVSLDYSARVIALTHMIVDELRSSYKILFAGEEEEGLSPLPPICSFFSSW
jgi:hypothetical protein